MSYITSSLTVIITLVIVRKINSYSQDYMYYPPKNYTRVLELKQGYIQGVVISPDNKNGLLTRVEHYRGIPYAAPPVGELRFMPPSGAPSWEGIKYADTFGPVCPQMFPSTENMAPQRLKEFLRLKNYLNYQLEDCLYLNVYVPHNPERDEEEKYPVIVFIHGESYEWNSGNPYDGSVLAAYTKVVVVTFNFRLGILGFLKIDSGDGFNSNFGLVDQIAALVWVRDNIEAFGGDPASVTLLGHGTGAACAHLLMQSPMIKPGNKLLCHRAILMGGTAIADWALASNPRDVTDQVARALQCEVGDKVCLRGKRLDEIMGAHVVASPYSTRFGPIVDSSVVPNDPLKSMTNLSGFQLMFGVTEWESKNMLGREQIMKGMLQKQRDQELLNYLGFTCEKVPDLCRIYTGSYYENMETVRDTLLDILSDARTVAPMLKMGILHSSAVFHSYFYVFTHKTKSKEHLRGKTSTGEELPYVFGVPLDGSSFHFVDNYTKEEVLFSKVIMTYIRNFAYGGNPNSFIVEREGYQLQDEDEVIPKMQYWPAFTKKFQSYSLLDIPIATFSHYRMKKLKFWNEDLPRLLENMSTQQKTTITEPPPKRPKGTPPFIIRYPFGHNEPTSESYPKTEQTEKNSIYGNILEEGSDRPDMLNKVIYGTVINSHHPSELQKATTINIIVICGGVFLLVNFLVFMALYYKCYMVKKNQEAEIVPAVIDSDVENPDKKNIFGDGQAFVANGGGLIKMISRSSKSDDVYEAVKLESQNSKKHRLVRQLSSSTIDAHTKVKDWIANGIATKNSPKGLKKPRNETNGKNKIPKANNGEISSLKQYENSEHSTLGRSPTRPVSPAIQSPEYSGKARGILKLNSHNSSQDSKKRDKVSVAIDATPSGRGPSVLAQQPIELSKSLDLGANSSKAPLRRSATMEDFSPKAVEEIADLTKSVTSLISQPTIVKISHSHSKSDPVEDIYVSSKTKKLRTFDPEGDINVTSCDEKKSTRPLSPEESLLIIKRRNFPKVLPDYPTKESLAHKRRSMPAPNLSVPINDLRHRIKMPPAPPLRTTSTLGRKPQTQPTDELVCNSAPVLLEENSSSPEPEFSYNNLYVGPLIPKNQTKNKDVLDTNPIYTSLSALKTTSTEKVSPVAIVTTDPKNPVKKPEPKTVIRPKIIRQMSDPKSRVIPRVTATDNMPGHHLSSTKTEKDDSKLSKIVENNEKDSRDPRSQRLPMILTPVSQNNDEKSRSGSETSPSEESDTGTVVAKRKD